LDFLLWGLSPPKPAVATELAANEIAQVQSSCKASSSTESHGIAQSHEATMRSEVIKLLFFTELI